MNFNLEVNVNNKDSEHRNNKVVNDSMEVDLNVVRKTILLIDLFLQLNEINANESQNVTISDVNVLNNILLFYL